MRPGDRRMERLWEESRGPPQNMEGGLGTGPGSPYLQHRQQGRMKIRGPVRRPRTPPLRTPPPVGIHRPPGPRDPVMGPAPLGRLLGPEPGVPSVVDRSEARRRWGGVGMGESFSDFSPRAHRGTPNHGPGFHSPRGPRGRDPFLGRDFPSSRGGEYSLGPPQGGGPPVFRAREGPSMDEGRSISFPPRNGSGQPSHFRSPAPPRSGPPWIQRKNSLQRRRSGHSLPRSNHDRDGPPGGKEVRARPMKPKISQAVEVQKPNGVATKSMSRKKDDKTDKFDGQKTKVETTEDGSSKSSIERPSTSTPSDKQVLTEKTRAVDDTITHDVTRASSKIDLEIVTEKEEPKEVRAKATDTSPDTLGHSPKEHDIQRPEPMTSSIAKEENEPQKAEPVGVGEPLPTLETGEKTEEKEMLHIKPSESQRAPKQEPASESSVEVKEEKKELKEPINVSVEDGQPKIADAQGAESRKESSPQDTVGARDLEADGMAEPSKKRDIAELEPLHFSNTSDILLELERIDKAIAEIRKDLMHLRPEPSASSAIAKANILVEPKFLSQISSVIDRNQTKAKAAAAAFRPICADTELGLDAPPSYTDFAEAEFLTRPIPEAVLVGVREFLSNRRTEQKAHNLKVRRKYCRLQKLWKRQLAKQEEEASVEKRELDLRRDRFLVANNYTGSSGVTRSSAGRVTPSVQEIDAYLKRVRAEGGSPGNVDIWSTTLADIPDQDRSFVPFEGSSVRIEDPLMYNFAAQAVNPWSQEEKVTFLEKFLVYQKNFRKISSFLKHKSSRDCVEFYYKNKIVLGLKELPKVLAGVKKKELKRAILEERALCATRTFDPEAADTSPETFLAYPQLQKVTNTRQGNMYSRLGLKDDETFEVLFRRNPGLQWPALESARFVHGLLRHGLDFRSISSFVGTRSPHECKEYYRQNKRTRSLELYLPWNGREGRKTKTTVWTPLEESEFDSHFKKFGRNWKAIAEQMPSKNADQVRVYWQKYRGSSSNGRKRKTEGEGKLRLEPLSTNSSAKNEVFGNEKKLPSFESVIGVTGSELIITHLDKRNAGKAGFPNPPSSKRIRMNSESNADQYMNGEIEDGELVPNVPLYDACDGRSSLDILASSATGARVNDTGSELK